MAPCLCAPTLHKGSFRCRHHRSAARNVVKDADSAEASEAAALVPCLCAPTSHPGSFRCHLHRATDVSWGGRPLRPSAHAKALIPVKAADLKAAFARSNPSKLRSELTKAMPETVAAVEDLRISPKKTIPKRNKLVPAPVPRPGMAKVAPNNEKAVQSETVSVKGPAEVIITRAAKRPTSYKDRRLRARSDILLSLTPPDLCTWREKKSADVSVQKH